MAPLELPHISISLQEGEDAAHTAIFDLCNEALEWGIKFEDVEFSKISGGISNILVKVAPKPGQRQHAKQAQHEQQQVLEPAAVKVFGEKTELLIDRAAEVKAVVALGAQGFGPKVLALFSNGRIEQFLDCMTLTPAQMCDDFFIPRIAALLARFHTVQVDLPDPHSSSLFKTIRRWLDMAKHLEFDQPSPKAAAYAALDFAQMEWEVDEVETACLATGSPVVFCHCDLLSGNFLVLQPPGFDPERPDLEGPLTVIDFEYGAYAQRGFDFGNHFNEYAGFECDYTRYPGREKQALFFTHYMGTGCTPAVLSEQQLDRLCAEANVFALASHIFWGVWSIVQARYSPIDFDYMDYHHLRFGELRRRKQEFLTEAARVFGGSNGGDECNGAMHREGVNGEDEIAAAVPVCAKAGAAVGAIV